MSTPTPPTIHIPTPRLTLRTPSHADAAAFHTYLTDPRSPFPEPTLTLDAVVPRIDRILARKAAGEGSLMLLILRGDEVIGFGGFNSLVRTAMLDSAARKSDVVAEGERVLVGDMGVGINARHQRQGFAREAICAMAEYGFTELGCGYMHMDTAEENAGFRALMGDMGLEGVTGSGVEVEDAVFRFAWQSVNYDWDRGMWERVKAGLKARGKWPL